jgi:hypothetical protein
MRTDRQTDIRTNGKTDMEELIVDFRNFANVPRNNYYLKIVMPIHKPRAQKNCTDFC